LLTRLVYVCMNKSEQIARLRLIIKRNIGPMTFSL
jgi:hypothetical protein